MSPSIREQILLTVETVLAGTVKVGSKVYRSRVDAFGRNESPSILIETIKDDQKEEISICKLDWDFKFRITTVVREKTPDSYADPIVQDIHSRIVNSWLSGALKPLLIDMQPLGYFPQMMDGDQPIALIHQDFRVAYRTSFADLSIGMP